MFIFDFLQKEMNSFLIELLLSIFVFVYKEKRRRFFIVKLILTIASIFAIINLYTYILNLNFGRHVPVMLHNLKYILALMLCISGIMILFEVTFRKAILHATGGYALQNLSYYTALIIQDNVDISFRFWRSWQGWLLRKSFFVVISAAALFVMRIIGKNKVESDMGGVAAIVLSLVIVLVSILLSTLNSLNGNNLATNIYAIALDATLIAVQLGMFQLYGRKSEVKMLEQIIKMEKKQHEISKETIEIINLKCHNIKHQIAALAENKNEEYRRDLKDIQDRIMIYSSIANTGNGTLDIILTEKSLICENNDINLSCMIDGEALSFMEGIDICILFGNAIENAIESVMNQDDKNKRIISLNVSNKQNFLNIHMENYCDNKLEFSDGIPLTKKDDKNFHGFGTKSIYNIARKYSGNVVMYQENDMFILDVIIPLKA